MQKNVVDKPKIIEFGTSMNEMQSRLTSLSDSVVVRKNKPIQLPTAKNEQSQLDVYGFEYAGKKRKAEFIFADDALDIVWILTDAEEEQRFIQRFKSKYGDPSHIKEEVTFFLDNATAVRNKPHEVLFISERLIEQYRQFLKN